MIVTDYNTQSLSFELMPPEQKEENVITSTIKNKGECFYVQTPRLSYHYDKDLNGNNIKLFLKEVSTKNKTNSFYHFIQNVENVLSILIEKLLHQYIDDDNNVVIENLFKSSIQLPYNLNDPLYIEASFDETDAAIYDKHENKLQEMEHFYKSESTCTFVLAAQYVQITPTKAHIQWKVVQGLLHYKKHKKITGFEIQSEPSEQEHKLTKLSKSFFLPKKESATNNKHENKEEDDPLEYIAPSDENTENTSEQKIKKEITIKI